MLLSLRAFGVWPKENACRSAKLLIFLKTPRDSRWGRLGVVAVGTDWSSLVDALPRHSEDALGDADVRMEGDNGVSGECNGPRTSDPSVTRRLTSAFVSSHLSGCDWTTDAFRRYISSSTIEPCRDVSSSEISGITDDNCDNVCGP